MKQNWESGSVLKIPFNGETFCYAQMLPHENCELAIFDSRTTKELDITEVVNLPILFRVAIHKSSYNNGRWQIVGNAPIKQQLLEPRETYIEDPVSGKFEIYKIGNIRPATKEECIGLECCSVWEPQHVEERIADHYAGRKCRWLNEFWRKENI